MFRSDRFVLHRHTYLQELMGAAVIRNVPALLALALATLIGACRASFARTEACATVTRGRGILSSSLYPSDAPTNQICQWTLTAYPSQVIGVYFEDFDLSQGSILKIYNGSTSDDEFLLTSYSGTSAAKIDVTLDGVATLVFHSPPLSLNHRGFLLMYYSIDPPQRSDTDSVYVGNETIIGGGSLSSPGYSGWYPNSARYTWTLRSCEEGAPLKLVFKDFSIEQTYDRVLIYDGDVPDQANFRSSFTGNELPPDLTLGSVATVVFISDSVVADRGFAATFSTVTGSSAVTADNATMKRVCTVSCPTSVRLDYNLCYAHDDPHMRTFDGHVYEHQKQGVFYLYKHDTAPIWVQAAFQSCGSVATCSCAVAVRYWGELFVVDRCKLRGINYRPDRVYKLGSGSMMSIEQHGVGFQVRLPNGLRVLIGKSWAWIGAVDLYPAYGDQNAVQGLCGRYNGNPYDDGTYRCGFDATADANPWETWRVPEEEMLFTAVIPRYAFNMSACNCSHLPRYALPHGVLNATGLPPSELSNARYFDIDDSATPGENGPWPDGWTQNTATQYCNNYIENNAAIKKCEEVLKDLLDLDGLLNDCVRDIYLTGGTAFALTALEASKEKCISALQQYNITNPSLLPCPNDCWQRGQCVNGTCRCQPGFYGADCSTNPGNAPHLRNSTAHPSCLPSGTVGSFCNQEQVFGETFYDVMPTNPKCKINVTTFTLLADGTAGRYIAASSVTLTATYESPSALICPLPAPASNSTALKMVYAISVTNNGLNFSNAISTSRVFIPHCGGYRVGSGTITSPNYPQDYRNSALCLWNLTASTNSNVELSLRNFVLNEDGDSVQLFDQGCLIDRWTGTQPKQIFTYGPALSLLFTSSQTGSSKGFNVTFNSVAKVVSCGGSVFDRGTLLSPKYPSSYTKQTYCMWKLFAGVGKTGLSLQFNAFNTETGYDYLTVYNGTLGACNLIQKLSGDNLPPIMKLGLSATIVFRTDDDTEMSGFNITVTSY